MKIGWPALLLALCAATSACQTARKIGGLDHVPVDRPEVVVRFSDGRVWIGGLFTSPDAADRRTAELASETCGGEAIVSGYLTSFCPLVRTGWRGVPATCHDVIFECSSPEAS